MSARLAKRMLSYIRELRRSRDFYSRLATEQPHRENEYRFKAWRANEETWRWLRWAREEAECVGPSPMSRLWPEQRDAAE